MAEHDGQVKQLLKKLDDLGIADNTIVIYTTDNGGYC
jgi:arylsulfatase A-like enzyme